jgi:hypothetical protein
MIVPLAAALLPALSAAQAPPAEQITLQRFPDRFEVRRGETVERVPIEPAPEAPRAIVFRRDDTFAVWDERGLSVRKGERLFTSRLPDVPTSPRVQPRERILQTIPLLESGRRSREASALSGARRLGSDAFFLVRWEESDGAPWLEALMKVDLSADEPRPQFVGRFEGLSLSRNPIGDRLGIRNGALTVLVRTEADVWGEALFEVASGQFDFKPIGAQLESAQHVAADRAFFVERAGPRGRVAGIADLRTGERESLFEVSGEVAFVDERQPALVRIQGERGAFLRNAATGAETPLPESAVVRRVEAGVLVWSPAAAPTGATLFHPDRWDVLARWLDKGP